MATAPQTDSPPASRRATLIVSVIAVLIIVMPFLFWRSTWFGRQLSDEQITEYLADEEAPRKAQHALAQISSRTGSGDATVRQWYPQILALADHRLPKMRTTVAWLMGQDNRFEAFRTKLRQMLEDPEPVVRRNAALSLVRFNDGGGREELLAMLGPFTVEARHAGILTNRLEEGDPVDHGTLLARIAGDASDEPSELRSPLPGVVSKRLMEDGARVTVGDPITVLGPSAEHIFQALRGLYLVGKPEDLDAVRPYLRPRDDMSVEVFEQARLTADQIRNRASQGPHGSK